MRAVGLRYPSITAGPEGLREAGRGPLAFGWYSLLASLNYGCPDTMDICGALPGMACPCAPTPRAPASPLPASVRRKQTFAAPFLAPNPALIIAMRPLHASMTIVRAARQSMS